MRRLVTDQPQTLPRPHAHTPASQPACQSVSLSQSSVPVCLSRVVLEAQNRKNIDFTCIKHTQRVRRPWLASHNNCNSILFVAKYLQNTDVKFVHFVYSVYLQINQKQRERERKRERRRANINQIVVQAQSKQTNKQNITIGRDSNLPACHGRAAARGVREHAENRQRRLDSPRYYAWPIKQMRK